MFIDYLVRWFNVNMVGFRQNIFVRQEVQIFYLSYFWHPPCNLCALVILLRSIQIERRSNFMTQKEQLLINAILESVGLEPIQSAQTQRQVHDEG